MSIKRWKDPSNFCASCGEPLDKETPPAYDSIVIPLVFDEQGNVSEDLEDMINYIILHHKNGRKFMCKSCAYKALLNY